MVERTALIRHCRCDQNQRDEGPSPRSAPTTAWGAEPRWCGTGRARAPVEAPALRVCPFGPVSLVPAHEISLSSLSTVEAWLQLRGRRALRTIGSDRKS